MVRIGIRKLLYRRTVSLVFDQEIFLPQRYMGGGHAVYMSRAQQQLLVHRELMELVVMMELEPELGFCPRALCSERTSPFPASDLLV